MRERRMNYRSRSMGRKKREEESKRREKKKTAKYLTSDSERRQWEKEEERERETNADLNRRREVKLNELDKKGKSPEGRILGR